MENIAPSWNMQDIEVAEYLLQPLQISLSLSPWLLAVGKCMAGFMWSNIVTLDTLIMCDRKNTPIFQLVLTHKADVVHFAGWRAPYAPVFVHLSVGQKWEAMCMCMSLGNFDFFVV